MIRIPRPLRRGLRGRANSERARASEGWSPEALFGPFWVLAKHEQVRPNCGTRVFAVEPQYVVGAIEQVEQG